MKVIGIREATRRASELLDRAMAGEEIVIGKAGKPIALLGPYPALPKRRPGSLKRKIKILLGFDEMDKEIEKMFYGEPD